MSESGDAYYPINPLPRVRGRYASISSSSNNPTLPPGTAVGFGFYSDYHACFHNDCYVTSALLLTLARYTLLAMVMIIVVYGWASTMVNGREGWEL